jgi:hypothetical protein
MLARIYNKTEEIKTTGKDWFKTAWFENGWDGKKDVWRIEFQLRREALKELGIDKVEDIKGNEERLWNYLTNNWLKMNDPKWEKIKQASEVIVNPFIRTKVKQGDIKRLTNQTNGLLISIGSYADITDINKVLNFVKIKAQANLKTKNTTFQNEVKKRRSKYLADKEKATGL